jgi:hypothetical protein
MKILRIVWALPNTLLGLAVGFVGVLFGGHFHRTQGAIEFHGIFVRWILQRMPGPSGGAAALTIGHVILGTDAHALEFCRSHEHVHVRQYERWGPFFLPAYFGCSAWLWLKGRNAYYDNPFEKEAYGETDNCEEIR